MSAIVLCSCTGKEKKSLSSASAIEQLEVFVSKQKKDADGTFVYSGIIQKEDWKKIGMLVSGSKGRIFLDFSKAKCADDDIKIYMPSGCFRNNDRLTGIKLPEGLEELYEDNFYECPQLKSIYFPRNRDVKYIGYNSLTNLKNLEEVHLYNFSGIFSNNFLHDINSLKIFEMPEYPVRMERSRDYFNKEDFGAIKYVQMGKKKVSFDEWHEMCLSIKPKDVPIVSAKASSSASEKYSADNLFDGSWKSWVEGKADEGIGESIELTLSEPTSIVYLNLKNGFGNLDYYLANNRVKKLEVTLDDMSETTRVYDVHDTPYFQIILIKDYKKTYSKIKLVIKDVYKGIGPDNDTCISEIRVNSFYGGYEMDPGYNRLKSSLQSLEEGFDYRIFPVEDGSFVMGVSHYDEENYSTKDFAGLFVNEKGKWKSVYGETLGFEKTSVPASIQPVVDVLEVLKLQGIPFKMEFKNDGLSFIPLLFDSNEKLSLDFACTKDGFTGFEKNPFSAVCFGTPEELEQFDGWKKSLGVSADSLSYNFLVYAAALNKNPEMISHLVEKGYSPNEYYSGNLNEKITPFEASIKYKNNAAREALLKAGAHYRKELLVEAFVNGDLKKFEELSQNYNDITFVLGYASNAFYNWRDRGVGEPVLVHMEKFLNLLKSRNVDFSSMVEDEKGRETSLLKQAISCNIGFIDLLMIYDWKIKGDEVADFIDKHKYDDDRQNFIPTLKKLDRKSPFKDLSQEQKGRITWKIAYENHSIDEIKFFIDRNAIAFTKEKQPYGDYSCMVLHALIRDHEEDNGLEEVIKVFVESGADLNATAGWEDDKTETVIGSFLRRLDNNKGEKYYRLFEYLYEKGARPTDEEVVNFFCTASHDIIYDIIGSDGDFDLRYKYIYGTIFRNYSGKKLMDGKTLAQLIIERLKYSYSYSQKENLEENLLMITDDLKKTGHAGDWKKKYFEKAGFSKEFSEKAGV